MADTGHHATTQRRSRDASIGSFTRMEEIGRGSFATVYKAMHTSSDNVRTLVAIKSVNLGKLNKKLKDNLTSEISILKGLHHPHIVALIDCKDTSSHIHLIMEYVALGDLSYFIKKRESIKDNAMVGSMMVKYPNAPHGGLNEVVTRHFFQQLASALQFLRERNLIHRDVKPQNLLLSPSPEYFAKVKPEIMPYLASDKSLEPLCGVRSLPMLKIADFGFARSLPSTSLAETLCGSPLYMAPEILRYEKYDAKADLWSVGTVLFEMVTARPPFRASNHVELLRKIEKGEDQISFPKEIEVSSALKKLIRALLKRDPKERLSFSEFFDNEILHSVIPNLKPEDRKQEEAPSTAPKDIDRRRVSRTDPTGLTRPGSHRELESPYSDADRNVSAEEHRSPPLSRTPQEQQPGASSRPSTARRLTSDLPRPQAPTDERPRTPVNKRPPLASHATAPTKQDLRRGYSVGRRHAPSDRNAANVVAGPSLLREQVQDREREQALQRQEEQDRERVAHDIAFERDYVVVEKKSVEVNALADELEASPKISRGALQVPSATPARTMVRRATTTGTPAPTTGAQANATRALNMATAGRSRPDPLHHRQSSYERRYGPSPGSAASAISKALSAASGRLFGFGISPPVGFGRTGRSPPLGYGAFPTYPAAQSSLVVVGDTSSPAPVDDDTRNVIHVEELATRSDVVYGFAEVKYRQLTPTTPSAQTGLGLRQPNTADDVDDSGDDGLTVEATVTVAEEALVLYVKALSLLAKSMDVAARWWAQKNRGEFLGETMSPKTNASHATSVGNRMNNVVQWVRGRFNEVLEKAELVRLRLIDSQRRLPEDHPSHPSNISVDTNSSMGTSSDQVVVSSGVTAEKLMYDRALEMSRAAAINELTGDDLPGCEISYVTAIRMLEAVLESDDDSLVHRGSRTGSDKLSKEVDDDDLPINGMEAEDRKTVRKLVESIRARLAALRKKLQVIQKRASAPAIGSPNKSSTPVPHLPSIPHIATTPPR